MNRRLVAELISEGMLRVEDGNHGEYRPRPGEFVADGVPFIRAADMSSGVINFANAGKIDSTARARIRKGIGAPGDVILSHKGTVGRIAVAPGNAPDFVCSPQTTFWRSLKPDALEQRYLRYAMRSIAFTRQLDVLKGQTDMAPYVSLSDQRSMTLELPEIGVQRAIAEVLGALDDKIAANERIRRIADDLLASVFDRLRAGSLQAELGAIGTVNRAVTNPVPGGRLRYVDISSVGQGSFDFPGPMSWDHAPGQARRVLSRGDTVWSTVRPNRRSHALVLDDDPLLVASTGLAVLSPKPGRVAGLFEATKTDEFVRYLESVAEGSAYPAVRGERFERAPVPHLSEGQWNSFEQLALPVRRRVHIAERESRRLAMMRDELLPLLMSGKVRVKNAEAVVGDVV